jgi:hypothetical protein
MFPDKKIDNVLTIFYLHHLMYRYFL